jgi:hypothetical protein
VHITGAADLGLRGEIVAVRVVRSNKHSLQGELTSEARAAAKPRPQPDKSARRSLPIVAAEGA